MLQRPCCVREEEGPVLCGRAARCESQPAATERDDLRQCVAHSKEFFVLCSEHQAKPECSVVQKAWLQGVLPAVMDAESSVQDKALEALDQVVLCSIKAYFAGRHLDAGQRLTWDLLTLLCNECKNLRLD